MHYSQRFKIISEGNSNFADSNIFPSNKRCLDDIIVKLINTDHIEPFGPAQVIPDSSISFLTSGGTIACNPSDNRGSAPQSLDSIIHSISDESSILELFKPVDSSQLTSSHFSTILKQAIATIQTNKIGILSHGTDTLGNNAYALSILLHPYLRLHQVSFFITGSFMSSDGVFNLSQTFLIAKNHSSDFPPDVYVCIKSHETDEEMAIIPGNQFEKIQTHPDNQSSGLKRDPIFVSGQAFGTFRNNKFYKSQHIPSQEPPFEHGKLSSAHPKWKMLKNIILAKTNPLSQPYPSVLPNIFVYIVSQWTTSKELESISHQFSKPNNPFTGLFIYHSSGNVDFASQLKVISKVIPILIFKEMPVLSINRKVTPLLNEPTLHTDLNTEKNPNFLFFNHTNFQKMSTKFRLGLFLFPSDISGLRSFLSIDFGESFSINDSKPIPLPRSKFERHLIAYSDNTEKPLQILIDSMLRLKKNASSRDSHEDQTLKLTIHGLGNGHLPISSTSIVDRLKFYLLKQNNPQKRLIPSDIKLMESELTGQNLRKISASPDNTQYFWLKNLCLSIYKTKAVVSKLTGEHSLHPTPPESIINGKSPKTLPKNGSTTYTPSQNQHESEALSLVRNILVCGDPILLCLKNAIDSGIVVTIQSQVKFGRPGLDYMPGLILRDIGCTYST